MSFRHAAKLKLIKAIFYIFSIACFVIAAGYLFTGCAFKSVARHKNIVYLPADPVSGKAAQGLDVLAPRHHKQPKAVLLFIHGGNWNSGKKWMYRFFGNRFARTGIVTVIIDYPLSPKANYDEMATDAALSLKWVTEHISAYGGDPKRIFISGHSAGGHLAALLTVRNDYFQRIGIINPIRGAILIDAAGLDMYDYLKEEDFDPGHTYLNTFTNDTTQWKAASPIFHLHADMPPMLIYRGGRTYPSILESNERFLAAMQQYVPGQTIIVLPKKKHIAMITQFFNSSNPRYREMLEFINRN